MIRVTVKNRSAVAVPLSPVTSGAVGIPVTFTFTDDWDGLTKLAVFRSGNSDWYDMALGQSNACVVPHEVLVEPGSPLYIGVYGENGAGSLVIPTIWADAGMVEPGAHAGNSESADPTPTQWSQIQALANQAAEDANAARVIAETANDNVETALEQTAADRAAAETAAATAQNAQSAADTSATAAAGSASAASGSASAAAGSATNAAGSASAAAATAASIEGALDGYVQKETGKGLSSNDFTDTYKNKIGTAELTTTASDLCGGVNELDAKFPVSIANGGTGGTTAIGALNSLGALNIGTVGTELTAGTNIDTDLTPGHTYYSPNSARTQTLAGTVPITTSGFKLFYIRAYSPASTYLHQIAIAASKNIFHRYKDASDSAWTAWIHLVRSDEVIDVAHGGTGQTDQTTTNVASDFIASYGANFELHSLANCCVWGKMVMLNIQLKCKTAISGGGSGYTYCTLKTGYRPPTTTTILDSSGNQITIGTNGAITGWRSTVAVDATVNIRGVFIRS